MKILIVEGNTQKNTAALVQNGCRNYVEIFTSLLKRSHPNCFVYHVNPNNLTAILPSNKTLQEYDGVIWTGSLSSTYDDTQEINRQLEFATSIFQVGIPIFGSCFGMQIAVVAAGGNVGPCSKGFEIGITNPITMTEAGNTNTLLTQRKNNFRALCVHGDEVSKLPPRCDVLAYNSHSDVQAIEIYHLNGKFTGVQYHPEFTVEDLLGVFNLLKNRLLGPYGENLNEAIMQLSNEITDYQMQALEVNNWLNSLKVA